MNNICHSNNRFNYYKTNCSELDLPQYRSNLLHSYETKSNVFYQLVQKYKYSLSSSIDDRFYAGIGMLIGLVQNNYHLIELNENAHASKAYNFYKDSNIPEIQHTTALLNKLETRVLIELKQWPDHAVLDDVSLFLGFYYYR